jgi:hypothetical protein
MTARPTPPAAAIVARTARLWSGAWPYRTGDATAYARTTTGGTAMGKDTAGPARPGSTPQRRRHGPPPQDFVTAGPRTVTEHLVDGPDDAPQDEPDEPRPAAG